MNRERVALPMDTRVKGILEDHAAVTRRSVTAMADTLVQAAGELARTLSDGGKILLFGNGGSAADAQHIAAEFVNRFLIERPPLAAIALTTDTSILTAIGNDYGYSEVFAKQVAALGDPGDAVVGISTSGNSKNVLKGIEEARRMGLFTLGMAGNSGDLAGMCDLALTVDSSATPRIQETHALMGHILCELVDAVLFPDKDGGRETPENG